MSRQWPHDEPGDQHGYGCLVAIPAGLIVWAVVMWFFGLQGVLILGSICAIILFAFYYSGRED